MSIKQALQKAAAPRRNLPPVWAGPCGEGPQGGVTQGLVARWLSCRERFRVSVVEGLRPAERFNPAIDFGNMWHACEEAHAESNSSDGSSKWEARLMGCESELARKYPLQRMEIAEWAGKCAALFPRYVEHWSKHPDVVARTPLLAEQTFDVPHALPSGRVVRLRGKWDSVDLVGKGKEAAIWLQENKTKGTVDGTKVQRQLTYDLQTQIYLIALGTHQKNLGLKDDKRFPIKTPIVGVRYNVVRRAAHKSVGSMLEKLGTDERCGRIGEWFARWNVEVTPADVARFKRECLDPVLENMCDDYNWWAQCKKFTNINPFTPRAGTLRHFRMPYCGYNPLAEGGFGDVDEYLANGSTVGLKRVENLFPELQGA